MKRFAQCVLFVAATGLPAAVVIDRIAVIVDNHAIKQSDLARDLRLTEFLNGQPPDLSLDARKKSAERLIEQELLREEIANGGFHWAPESEAREMVAQIRTARYGGSDTRLRAALDRYRLQESDLLARFQWQLTVLRYIDQRFRNGVVIADDDVRNYYEQHKAQLQRENPRNAAFTVLEPKIRASLEGERINQNFAEAMKRARQNRQIRYLKGAFQ